MSDGVCAACFVSTREPGGLFSVHDGRKMRRSVKSGKEEVSLCTVLLLATKRDEDATSG